MYDKGVQWKKVEKRLIGEWVHSGTQNLDNPIKWTFEKDNVVKYQYEDYVGNDNSGNAIYEVVSVTGTWEWDSQSSEKKERLNIQILNQTQTWEIEKLSDEEFWVEKYSSSSYSSNYDYTFVKIVSN